MFKFIELPTPTHIDPPLYHPYRERPPSPYQIEQHTTNKLALLLDAIYYSTCDICWVAESKKNVRIKKCICTQVGCVGGKSRELATRGKYEVTGSWRTHFLCQVMLCRDFSLCWVLTLYTSEWLGKVMKASDCLTFNPHTCHTWFMIITVHCSICLLCHILFESHQTANNFTKTHHTHLAEY